jgi:hypothetical protein
VPHAQARGQALTLGALARSGWPDQQHVHPLTLPQLCLLTAFAIGPGSSAYAAKSRPCCRRCCVADGRPIDVGVQSGAKPPPTDTWVTATGTYAGAGGSDGTLPLLTAMG